MQANNSDHPSARGTRFVSRCTHELVLDWPAYSVTRETPSAEVTNIARYVCVELVSS